MEFHNFLFRMVPLNAELILASERSEDFGNRGVSQFNAAIVPRLENPGADVRKRLSTIGRNCIWFRHPMDWQNNAG